MSATAKPLIAVISLLVFAEVARAEPVAIASKLNLRAGPGPAFGVTDVIPAGAKVDVRQCSGEWCSVRHGRRTGHVSREFVRNGADAYASAAPVPAAPREAAAPTLTGPRIWRWRDPEWRDQHWRDLEWRNRFTRH